MRLIDADYLKEILRLDARIVLFNRNYDGLLTDLIDECPSLDFEKTMQSEYQNGYWSGYNDAMKRVRKEQKNEIN